MWLHESRLIVGDMKIAVLLKASQIDSSIQPISIRQNFSKHFSTDVKPLRMTAEHLAHVSDEQHLRERSPRCHLPPFETIVMNIVRD